MQSIDSSDSIGVTDTYNVVLDVVPVNSCSGTGDNNFVSANDVDRWMSLVFDSVTACLTFYKDHAHRRGFGVRVGSNVKRKTSQTAETSIIRYIYYFCNKQGYKENSLNDPSHGNDVEKLLVPSKEKKRQFKEERTGCEARIQFIYNLEKKVYVITLWDDTHNHPLHDPELAHFIRSSRQINEIQGLLIEANKNAGLSDKPSYELICQASGGIESAGFLKSDMKFFLRGKRTRDMSAGELSILLKFLSHESQTKPSFFYDIQLDEDSLITNIFWSDGVMQHDYSCFGDVISLDTTFRTNNEYFPLAAFLGFSHNRQSCIFGAALLHNQSTETFEWLFHVFLKCMGGKRPLTLFTDQDAAMKKAISIVLPECFHGLCSWHICQNAAKRLGSLATKQIFSNFHYLINQVDNEAEFEENWRLMVDDCFGGVQHSWLDYIYPFREHWSSAWVRSHFTAGLKSTQVSESFNAFLRDYVSVKYSLPQFFHNFNIMLDHMREKLNKSVFDSTQYLPSIRFNHSSIVNHAAQVYTPAIFNLFQEEYSFIPLYFVDQDESTIGARKMLYSVFKEDHVDRNVKLDERQVIIDLDSGEWICSCRKFINWSILCCHILKVVDILGSSSRHADLRVIPDRYMLTRWTRKARGGVGTWSLPKPVGHCSSTFALRHQAYCSSMIRISSRVCVDDDTYCFFMKGVNDVLSRVEERLSLSCNLSPPMSIHSISSTGNSDCEVQSRLNSAKGIKKKSNPIESNKRLKSTREIAMERIRAKRNKTKDDQVLSKAS